MSVKVPYNHTINYLSENTYNTYNFEYKYAYAV